MGKKARLKKIRNEQPVSSCCTSKKMLSPRTTDRRLWFMGITAAIIIGAGILLGTTGVLSPAKSSSALVPENSSYDFGDIDINGGKVETEFPLKNTGEDPIIVTAARTSCMCTEGFIDGESFGMHTGLSGNVTINPGETKAVKAIFDPLAHGPEATGPIDRDLKLQTNSTVTKEITLKFRGNVVKNISENKNSEQDHNSVAPVQATEKNDLRQYETRGD